MADALRQSAVAYAIITMDKDSLVTSWNEGARRLLGWSEDEMLGRSADMVFVPEDIAAGAPQQERATALRNGTAEDERWHARKDGDRFFASGLLMTLRDGSGGFLKIMRDRTEHLQAERNQLRHLEQMRSLAHAARTIMSTTGLKGTLQAITDEARRIIGAHQAVSSITRGPDWSQAVTATSMSDKYAAWNDYADRPDGSGIYGWVCEGNRTVRMTEAELEAHPRWRGFGGHANEHPPMRGWLATAFVGSDGRNLGLIQLSDKVDGDFDETDEAIIVQLAQFAASAIERAHADEERVISEGRFRAAVEALQGVLWTNSGEGRMVGHQPGWTALTGQTFEKYEGYGWSEAVHPDDVEGTVAAWRQAVRTRAPFEFQHRVRRRDGEWRMFSVRAIPVLDRDGNVTEWVGVHTDISERHQAERNLSRETERLTILNRVGATLASELDLDKLVQAAVDAGTALAGADFGAFFYNVTDEAGEHYTLYALAGAAREDFARFPMPRNTPVFKPTFTGESVIRSDDIVKDPRYGQRAPHRGMPEGHLPVRSYLAVPVVSRSGAVLGGLFFGHRKTGMFTHEHEQLLIGVAGQAAIAIDNASLYRASQREIAERKRAEEALRNLNETLESRVLQEVKERARTEEALRQSQKMEAIGQLTGGVAHDFNNLLTIVRTSVDFLRRRDLPEERRRRYVDAIVETVERAAKLTGQLLAFARRQALKPEVFNVPARVETISDMLRTLVGSRIEITTDVGCEECHVEADVSQFETALVNMAVNARDAMDSEGRLAIAVRAVDRMPAIRDHAGGDGEFVCVSLTDTGAGMAPEQLPHVFEPFYTTKEVGKGTGLGLSQVYGFAKQSGGDVAVESTPGKGTTFTLYLPRVNAPDDTDEVADAGEAIGEEMGRGRRVLVVEDNIEVGRFSTQSLQDLGYETTWAANANEALAILAERPGDFDVVFSDVIMPGINGVELGREIRRRHPGLPVVLTSGYSHVLAEEGRHGFELLQKPYAVEELSRILRRVTGRRRRR